MQEADWDAIQAGRLYEYLDSLDKCPHCGKVWEDEGDTDHECEDYEPDPDRFRDEDPADAYTSDREDY